MADRVKQIASHLNYPKGLLNGEVAIITGTYCLDAKQTSNRKT